MSGRFKESSEDENGYYVRLGTGVRGSSVYFTETHQDIPVENEDAADTTVTKLLAKRWNVAKHLHGGTWYVRVMA